MKKLLLFMMLISITSFFAQSKQVDEILDNSKEGVSTVYKDGTAVVKTIYDDAKTLSPKIESAIKSLANGLRTTTSSLWDILVKQQLVWSICFLTLTLASLFNWYMFYKRMYPPKKNLEWVVLERDVLALLPNPDYNKYSDNSPKEIMRPSGAKEQFNSLKDTSRPINSAQEVTSYIHLLLCLVLSYFSFIHFSDMLTGFINPEFGALKTIVTVAQTLK